MDAAAQMVAEVLTVVPSDEQGAAPAGQAAQQQTPAPAAVIAPLPAIAPPPPPADAPPPTISLGQTKEQVTAAFGQPVKTAKIGAKEIFYYKDMKVTFTNGKVTRAVLQYL